MNDRFKTDFLFPRSSFAMGFGRVLSISGELFEYNSCDAPDTMAIANDWRMVGQDIKDSLSKAGKEAPSAA